jgi:hypothetical protein
MQTIGIKALQTDPGLLGKALDSGDYLLIRADRTGRPA